MNNKITLVTGASRGIGKAIALGLSTNDNFVIGTATTDAGAQAISAAFESAGLKGKGARLDVTESGAIDRLIKDITGEFGTPTILINNAAVTRDNLLLRMKDEEWSATLETNLTGIFLLSRACLKGMIKARFGRIVNISSVVAATGNPGQTNYCAAKAGIIGFTKALAKEVGSRNITVNGISPGFIDTDMTRSLSDERKKVMVSAIPLNRLGEPDDVARAVEFLCSDGASYITGETIHVNGGLYMS